MCGIVGARHDWLLQNGLDPEAAMREAVAAVAWRGPDGQRVVRAGGWWLGCARLAIGPGNSRQPVVRRGGRFVGVMNGAITNARQLWARLLPGTERRAAPPNDAWLPLLAVQRGDREALAHLRGHHAYAVVDAATDQLVFGQDRFGEKPLLCLMGPHGQGETLLAFASSPTALRSLGMPPLPMQRRIRPLLRFGFAQLALHTFHEKLWLRDAAPARGVPFVALRKGGRCTPWQPTETAGIAPWPGPAEPVTLRERFFGGVARCIDTTQPGGLLLSGGIDSSCIAAALHHLHRPLPAYQFQAEGTDPAERVSARAVATACALPLHPVDGGPEVLDALPHLTRLAGIPLGDPSILAVHAVARAAAAHGVRVLLGGEGADELFFGYRRYRALATMPRLHVPEPLLPQWAMNYGARWLRAAAAPDPARMLLEVTSPAFRREVLVAPHRVAGPEAPDDPAGDRVALARNADLDGYLRLDLLPKVDIATMAASIEARCPWLEGDYAEWGLDPRAELGKQSLRAAFADDLPAIVFQQPKRGFALPLDRWFRGNLPWLDLLAERKTREREHLRPGGIAAVVDRHRSGRSNLGHGLYLLVAYELFLRTNEG